MTACSQNPAPSKEGQTLYQPLRSGLDLEAWEPLDGHAIVTCKIRIQSGAYDAWEPRTYEFHRVQDGWIIDLNPGYLKRESWEQVTNWLWGMRPIEIELLTTV